ncbi:MAG: MFS transporter [Patescibacteria group bacterium]
MWELFKPVLKNTQFWYLWLSQIFSQLTINIMNFLLLLRIYAITGSVIAASLLWVSYALPAILIGPLAAASVDMVARRKMLIVTNFLQSVAIFAYALVHTEKFFLLFGVAFIYSLLNQFYVPAEQASLPGVVPKENLPQANSLFFLTQQGSLIVGFGIAGVLNKFLGFEFSLYLCSLFLLLAFVSVSFLPELKTRQKLPTSLEQGVVKFFGRIGEGYNFIKGNPSILSPFLLLMAMQVASAVLVVNVPVLALEIFKIGINSVGLAVVVPAGIGAIVGSLIVSKLLKSGWRKKRAIETFLFVIALALMLLVFVTPQLTNFPRIVFGALTVTVIGLAFVGVLIPSQTFLQEATPGGMRGRVFGNYWFLVTLATIFPVVFSATLTELFGVRLLLLTLAGLAIVASFSSRKYGQKLIANGFAASENAE